MTDAPVSHRTRPLPCQVGLHRPAWVLVQLSPTNPAAFRVCAGCGVLLTGTYYDTAATTVLAASALLAAYVAARTVRLRTHRSRR